MLLAVLALGLVAVALPAPAAAHEQFCSAFPLTVETATCYVSCRLHVVLDPLDPSHTCDFAF
jgi:hypothetical protein